MKAIRYLIWGAILVAAGGLGWKWWQEKNVSPLPAGIASGNGRVESIQVDVSAKYGGRIKEVFVKEGDLVQKGQVAVTIDTLEREAELAKAKANMAEAEENAAQTQADIVKSQSELKLTEQNLERAKKLVVSRTIAKEEFDEKQAKRDAADAAVKSVKAKFRSVTQSIEAAQAEIKRVQTQIDDSTLKSPVRGRVLYRLAQVGEVLPPGGKALTLVNLEDIYMEIFLPSEQAARLKIGDEARITLDHAPGRAAVGHISFVSPEAQFTPKQVETRSERDKLMFRVKIQVPEELVSGYIERIKTGVRGVGYVKVDPSATWPDWLQNLVAPPGQSEPKSSAQSANSEPVSEAK
jgi:HlyD family secretion protein